MQAYKYRYTGLWLGELLIVVAPSESVAKELAIRELQKSSEYSSDNIKQLHYINTNIESLELLEVLEINQEGVIYNNNGDY